MADRADASEERLRNDLFVSVWDVKH